MTPGAGRVGGGPAGGPQRPAADVDTLVERARAGQARAVARLISLVENDDGRLDGPARTVAAALVPDAGRAEVIGITGSPGVGKSTTTTALIGAFRQRDRRVGVLAVDPSSPFSGGALLGDRVRMQEHATDDGVFIRSMATRGHLGGLAVAVPQALRILDAAGFDVILIETVGVGQAELEIAALADTTLVLLAPGMGDGIQAAKAGILEIADIFVVNKADRDGADLVARDLRGMLGLGGRHAEAGAWRPLVLKTVADRAEGIDELLDGIARHRAWSGAGSDSARRRQRRAVAEIEAITLAEVRRRLSGRVVPGSAAGPAADVVAGRTDPYRAAAGLLATLAGSDPTR